MAFLSLACWYNAGEEAAEPLKNISIVPKYPRPRLVNTMGKTQRASREIKGGFEAERMILMNLSSASRKKNLNTLGPAEQQTGGRYLNVRDVVLRNLQNAANRFEWV